MFGQITVKGKTNKGRSRVREHGSVFNIVEQRRTVCRGVAFNVESLENTDRGKPHRRWISVQNDPDFEIIKET